MLTPIKAKILRASEVMERGAKKFRVSEVIVVTDEKYPQTLKLELAGERAGAITPADAGRVLTGEIDVRGREYNGSVFNSLSLYKWELSGTSAPAPEQTEKPPF